MIFKTGSRTALVVLYLIGQILLAEVADALVPKQGDGTLDALTFVSEALQVSAVSEPFDDIQTIAGSEIVSTWDTFRTKHGDWSAVVDKRTGKIEVAEGEGIPFVPGRGNQLQITDISADLGDDREIDLARMEAITRAFLPRVSGLLGVDPSTLVLNQGRSGHPADYLWYVDFDVTYDGMVVEGAHVVFRVNSGNLIQFGSENLPAEGTEVPKAKVTRNQALKTLASYLGGFGAADSFLDGGSEHLIPVALANSGTDGFERGRGRGLARIWEFVFRRDGDVGTWRARIDATSGRMLEFRDMNDYATAQVTGGVNTSLGENMNLPMPFADVAPGIYANSAGVYNYTGGTVTSTLNGQYIKIVDECGAIAMTSDVSGNLAFGTSSGSDCDTPGVGGAGNTNSSRTQFYYLNRAKEIARGWLNLPWLISQQLTVNVNLADTDGDGICNAFWDGTKLNLYKKSGSCSSSGEIQAVGLHEFGHGLDGNDGNGPSPDKGTGETYGDWTATLTTHDSCIGPGYLSSNCDGFGDACISCTGVRDIDYAKHVSATPHTVGNFIQARCPAGGAYSGPCYQEGHCESYVSSEALWDLAVRDLPNPGSESAWAIMDRLWYLSRPTATYAFTCYRTTPTWTSDGCGTGSLWKTLRAVDDDDGNLSNGTPHSAALYAAFNRHGIACNSDILTDFRGCSQLATPALSVSAANNQVTVSWSGSTGVYDIYRNEQGCNAGGFIKVANDLTVSSFTDSEVANDFVYYYKVVAQPSGNEACASVPSSCQEAIPCLPPAAPTSVTATLVGVNQIDLWWADSLGATRYHIYRATSPGGPYTRIATQSGNTFSNTGLNNCTTYYYVVRAAKHATCESGASTQVAATTAGAYSSMTVSKIGTGTGTVTSSPGGINCGMDCSEPYSCNTLVTLTATPAEGFLFNNWAGACTGTEVTCTVTMLQARSVTAVFWKPFLTVGVSGVGGATGTVTSTPAGINCVYDCSEWYDYNTLVTLTATPAEGSMFIGWREDCTGTGTCTVSMTKRRSVTAAFALPLLTVSINADRGTVTSTPAGYYRNCGGGGICQEYHPYNSVVTLNATPKEGFAFSGWSGNCTGTGVCTLTMTQNRSVQANFEIGYPLTVLSAGNGVGTVTSELVGINCGVDCSEAYTYNTLVTLTAVPSVGSVFSGWSGACTGTGTCTVTMTQARSVTASFSLKSYLLPVSVFGTGRGTVTSTPAGINCPGDCSENYLYNTSVVLTATPEEGYVLAGWGSSGLCVETPSTCTLTMTQDSPVSAMFTVPTLWVNLAGTGSGTVTSTPNGIDCGADCSESYPDKTLVTLTATPATGSVFAGWSGECTGTGTCLVPMTWAARSVVATFSLAYNLAVSIAGGGSGAVTSTPAGINCGADCNETYNYNTLVTLTATPSVGSVFSGWSGACSGTGTCTVSMTQARSVTATFSVATYTLTVNLAGAGTGTVTSTPAGINCGVDCTEAYNYNTSVTLTATPSVGSVFSGWSGVCSGTGTCTVSMTQAQSVTATFSVATYTLTVNLAGAGSGTVTSNPAGINCGVDCTEAYNYNTSVTLTATPAVGSVFSGWSGACSGTSTCTVSMTQARSVTATFSVATYTLTVSLAGAGSGTVTSTPVGINCGVDCTEVYNYNTSVTLTATPAVGSVFSGWSGACSGTGTCTVSMTQAQSVTATFSLATYTLTVSLAGTGSGTVTSSPAGISCGVDCTEAYNYNTSVTLTATPSVGSVFNGWSGACSGTGTCTVSMTQARSVTATFSVTTYALTVNLAGAGSGTVTSTPVGINCGVDCTEAYNYNTSVTLTATPSVGSVFSGWSGACSGTGTCTVSMTQAQSVTATYSVATYTLTLSLAGAGSGTVTSSPAGINCGVDCTEAYSYNTSVTLTATPAVGSVFSGWSGACGGTGTCTVSMTQARSVTATFLVAAYTLTVNLAGAGSGTVTSTPAGINCGADCSEAYNYNTSVTLTATPVVGSVFSGWSGACSGTSTCTVTMTQTRPVTATFSVATYTLTVSLSGAGSGTVTSSPTGINCGADCTEVYNYNTSVTLTAAPAVGSVFNGWSGACSGTGTCTVSMTQAQSVTTTFSIATFALTVSKAGTGFGMVTSSPAGIDCGSDCSEVHTYGASVTLVATPSSALSAFTGWSGACTGTGSCTVTMSEARSVTATFDDKGQGFYTVTPCRVLDTRTTGTPLTSGGPLVVNVAGTCGVPSTAKAVSLNLTAIQASNYGSIALFPGDISAPGTTTVGFGPLVDRANSSVMPLATNGSGTLKALATITGGGTVDIALDVNGYFE